MRTTWIRPSLSKAQVSPYFGSLVTSGRGNATQLQPFSGEKRVFWLDKHGDAVSTIPLRKIFNALKWKCLSLSEAHFCVGHVYKSLDSYMLGGNIFTDIHKDMYINIFIFRYIHTYIHTYISTSIYHPFSLSSVPIRSFFVAEGDSAWCLEC